MLWALLLGACTNGPVDLRTHDLDGTYPLDLNGYADFEEGWEDNPYCIGGLDLLVLESVVTGEGECEITWGPVQGEVFDVSATGVAEEGLLTFLVEITYTGAEQRSWDTAAFDFDLDATDEHRVDVTYNSSVGPVDGLLGLTRP